MPSGLISTRERDDISGDDGVGVSNRHGDANEMPQFCKLLIGTFDRSLHAPRFVNLLSPNTHDFFPSQQLQNARSGDFVAAFKPVAVTSRIAERRSVEGDARVRPRTFAPEDCVPTDSIKSDHDHKSNISPDMSTVIGTKPM